MLKPLIAPVCALAALAISTPAWAGEDPVSEPGVETVEASEPVTLENAVAASEASVELDRTTHGGRFALGAAFTIAGLTGINARYYITDHFHLGVNLGVATFSFREPDLVDDGIDCGMNQRDPACTKTIRTLAYIGTSLEGIYWILGKPAGNLPFQANFGIGGRLGFQHEVNATDLPDLDDPLQFTAEIPLALALNFGENFAIIPEFGAVFRWNPGTRLSGDPTAMPPEPPDSNPGFDSPSARIPQSGGPGFGFELTDGIGLFGGASLMYTF